MGLHQAKELLPSKRNNHQTQETAHRREKIFAQLFIQQGYDTQTLQGTQNTQSPQNHQPNKEIIKQEILKRRVTNGQ
jgi:hypothetical protein